MCAHGLVGGEIRLAPKPATDRLILAAARRSIPTSLSPAYDDVDLTVVGTHLAFEAAI
jgi:hypothetical protein